nr:uncharacterized protein LOC124815171 isoform X2 [Hydra vulgaris]
MKILSVKHAQMFLSILMKLMIWLCQLYSYRHNIYKAGGSEKRHLRDMDLRSLLTEDQSNVLFTSLVTSFRELKNADYVFRVLVPEAIIYLFAKFMLVSRIQAEVTLNAYISKRNTEVLQDESSDSECSLVNVKDFTETCIVLSESEESAVKRLLDELVIKVSSYQENNFCGS